MASFAKLTEDNRVLTVLTLDDAIVTDENGDNRESKGQGYLEKHHGWRADLWKQTWKDGSIRKNYACMDYTYDEAKDAFIPTQPYPSWVLNETSCVWEPPSPMPETTGPDGQPDSYGWDEPSGSWIKTTPDS